MNKKYFIYMHINKINDKKYIGQTSQNPERRWRPDGFGYKDSPKFWNAIQKYGWDNFEHIILEVVDTAEQANEREKFWISFYNTFNNDDNGYNMTPGGDNYMIDLWKDSNYRERMCKSFSSARKKCWDDEDFAQRSLQNLLNGIHRVWNDPNWREARINNIKGDKNPNAKAVINIETGKIFTTIKEAAKWAGLNSVSGIGQCCRGKRNTSGVHPVTGEKLHWKYAEEVVK